MAVACKSCGRELGEGEGRKVADWMFCEACFQQLMDRAAQKSRAPVEAPASAAAPAEAPAAAAAPRCRGCGRELAPDQHRDLLGLSLCAACHDLFTQSFSPKVELGSPPEPEPEPSVPQLRVDVRATITCAGCGRSVPERGSKELAGQRYCPDCYQARAPAPALGRVVIAEARARGTAEEAPAPDGEPRCLACDHVTPHALLRAVEGFPICAACLATDRDLAVELARARHRRRLEQVKRELEE